MSQTKWDADNRNAVKNPNEEMENGQPDSCQDKPQQVGNPRSKNALITYFYGIDQLPAKRKRRKTRNPERSDREWQADNSDRQQGPGHYPKQETGDARSKNQPEDVAKERPDSHVRYRIED